jgi:hypothetical protein
VSVNAVVYPKYPGEPADILIRDLKKQLTKSGSPIYAGAKNFCSNRVRINVARITLNNVPRRESQMMHSHYASREQVQALGPLDVLDLSQLEFEDVIDARNGMLLPTGFGRLRAAAIRHADARGAAGALDVHTSTAASPMPSSDPPLN